MTEPKWGKVVRELRLKRNLTQSQLAKLAGISTVQVARIENDVLKPGICVKLARALGVPVSYLMDRLPPAEAFVRLTTDTGHHRRLAQYIQSQDTVQVCYVSTDSRGRPYLVVKVAHPVFHEIAKFILDDFIVMRITKSHTWVAFKRYDQGKSEELPDEGNEKLTHSIALLKVSYDYQDTAGSEIAKMSGVQECYAVAGEADILARCSSSSKSKLKRVLDEIEKIPNVEMVLKMENLLKVE